ARTLRPSPLCPGGGKAQLSSASLLGAGLLLQPPTPPPLLLLLFPLLLFSRLCGALAGPIIVEPHVTAVWGKNVSLKCLIEVNETITQISWEKIHGKSSQTVAVHHPQYGFSVQGEYQGRVLFKNYSLNDATITLHNIGFSDSGKYICKAVTFPLGNAQSSTTVTVLDAPEVSVTGYDGNWFVGRKGVNLKCNADANPPPFKSVWSRLDGQWPDGLLASDNTLHFVHPLTFNYSGVYICKVTNSL
ncbi:NECTIN3 isoform 7, partial [Pan troglodytes]